jgi:hypothetical protein
MTGFGAVRHIADIRADDASKEGENIITLQAGTNKFASQKGMTGFGAIRHVSDIRSDDCDVTLLKLFVRKFNSVFFGWF